MTVEKKRDRARPVKRGVCWCCASPGWLYFSGTAVGTKLNCAKCCRDTYGCKAGFTTDGIKIKNPVDVQWHGSDFR
jgi:hypothetical protein